MIFNIKNKLDENDKIIKNKLDENDKIIKNKLDQYDKIYNSKLDELYKKIENYEIISSIKQRTSATFVDTTVI